MRLLSGPPHDWSLRNWLLYAGRLFLVYMGVIVLIIIVFFIITFAYYLVGG